MNIEFVVKPRKLITCVGSRRDLERFIINPRFSRRYISAAVCSFSIGSVSAMIRMSSMYMIILRPNVLRMATIGLVVLVKTHGADDSPKGRQLN